MLPAANRRTEPEDASGDEERAQRVLAAYNRRRLVPCLSDDVGWERDLAAEHAHRRREVQYVERARASVRRRAATAPDDERGFVAWFEALVENGPGQNDHLFPWLRSRASLEEMRWFMRQEMAGEAGFDDLVALTQVRFDDRPKLELARNYWDEMGRGHAEGMHSPLLTRLGRELEVTGAADGRDVVWESIALSNLMLALASHRRYAYQSIGALGVIELTAPGRAAMVNAGLKRLGVGGAARRYFALHATLDKKHSRAWNREVIAPLVARDRRVARAIAEGALMRLQAGARCFERYRATFGFAPAARSSSTTQ